MPSIAFVQRYPSAGLLFVQLLGVVLYPLMESSPRGRAVFGVFGLLVLAFALWVVRRGPWLTWLAVTLAVPVVVFSVIIAFRPHPQLMITTAALEGIFYFYAAGSLIAYMLQDWHIAVDELFAAGATFTLLAWAFAYVFVVCQGLQPGSFGYTGAELTPRGWTELLYLSVAVLSSVGLSDIIPVTPMARALVMLESFAGIMYIALVLSRLINLAGMARKDRPES
ncbi:MAG TPA: ion channel [Gemmatimonadaceae bacterium]|nr:ion channel [Gemmatimonadaceae bacterium]